MKLIKKITLASFMILGIFSHAYADDDAFDTSPGWHYNDSKDELRGTINHMAYLFANNDKPVLLTLMNSNDPHNKYTVLTFFDPRTIPQFSFNYNLCNKVKDCSLLIKIGDTPATKYRVVTGKNNSISLLGTNDIINKIKSSHKLIVEIEMVDGSEQYSFNLDGLKWEK